LAFLGKEDDAGLLEAGEAAGCSVLRHDAGGYFDVVALGLQDAGCGFVTCVLMNRRRRKT